MLFRSGWVRAHRNNIRFIVLKRTYLKLRLISTRKTKNFIIGGNVIRYIYYHTIAQAIAALEGGVVGAYFQLIWRPRSGWVVVPLGVTGNMSDSGSEESWFEPRRGNILTTVGAETQALAVAWFYDSVYAGHSISDCCHYCSTPDRDHIVPQGSPSRWPFACGCRRQHVSRPVV